MPISVPTMYLLNNIRQTRTPLANDGGLHEPSSRTSLPASRRLCLLDEVPPSFPPVAACLDWQREVDCPPSG